ncbi:hypothetical protein NLJ89_g11522 [Agrocybe chaxingu]|uniref:Oxidoreductase AflY n=1 Tax=Agrocybe chaxingu TaxID=84603 RepID=A0A9W8JNK7_9AGAR|nr:hypothetical protein NLJ89_g11522 [Agrocybe chaxingu]
MLRAPRSFTTTMSRVSCQITRSGQVYALGITYASKKKTEELLLKDAEGHHCFINPTGFHNHLSHHLLVAYDLGASAGHLQKIYDNEAKDQRPRILEEKDKSIIVDKDNWAQYLGNHHAYSSFVDFFSEEIKALGVSETLEKYVFEEEANKKGIDMLTRVVSGAVHPFIQIGYGAEFGNDMLIATGIAQAAVHVPLTGTIFYGKIDTSPPSETISLLELLRRVYGSHILAPPLPYDPKAFISARMRGALADGRAEEIARLCSLYHISDTITDAEVNAKVEEIIWTTVLLMSATGRPERHPRLDFFLMHLVTSSLFVRPLVGMLSKPKYKAALLRTYIPVIILITLSRGRPRIDPVLVMSYTDVPRPPVRLHTPSSSALGNPGNDVYYNPWPAMEEGVRYHPDSHVLKAMRTLMHGTKMYGTTPPGGVPGTFRDGEGKEETHKGMAQLDGTLFVRAAGIMMNHMGWLGVGQDPGEWDRSALGWDAAWESEDQLIL